MAKRKNKVVVVHARPAKPAPSASAPTPAPAPAAKSAARDIFDWIVRVLVVIVFGVGLVTLALPWIHEAIHPWVHEASWQRLPPGVVCWRIERSTSAGTTRGGRCTAAPGWHWEITADDGGGAREVAVPDGAWPPHRRYYVP